MHLQAQHQKSFIIQAFNLITREGFAVALKTLLESTNNKVNALREWKDDVYKTYNFKKGFKIQFKLLEKAIENSQKSGD